MEEEEQDYEEDYSSEEEEEKNDKLDVITEENNYNSENYNYSSNVKDKLKSSSSSKYSNQNQTFKKQNEINQIEDNTNNIKVNFQNNRYFNDKSQSDKKENNNNIIYNLNNDSLDKEIENNIIHNANKNDYSIDREEIKETSLIKPDINYTDNEEINENNNMSHHNMQNHANNSDKKTYVRSSKKYKNNEDINVDSQFNDFYDIKENQKENSNNNGNYYNNNNNNLFNHKNEDDIIKITDNENSGEKKNEIINNKDNQNIDDSYENNNDNNSFKKNIKVNLLHKENFKKDDEIYTNNNNVNEEAKNDNEILNKKVINQNDNRKLHSENSNKNNNSDDDNYDEFKSNKKNQSPGEIRVNKIKLNNDEKINKRKNNLSMSLNIKNTNSNEIENENKQLSAQKGGMKILQLLISKKQEKEELEKKKEEIYIETFKRARSSQLLNIEKKTDQKLINEKEIKDENKNDIENNDETANQKSNMKNEIYDDDINNKSFRNENENDINNEFYDKGDEKLEDNSKKEKDMENKEEKEDINMQGIDNNSKIKDKNINNINREEDNQEIKDRKEDKNINDNNELKKDERENNETVANKNNDKKVDKEDKKIIAQKEKFSKALIYTKNSKKVPYRKFKTSAIFNKKKNNNSNNLEQINENKNKEIFPEKQIIESQIIFNKKNSILNQQNSSNNNCNINSNILTKSLKENNVNNNYNTQNEPSFTPFDSYMDFEQKTFLRNNRKMNSKEDNSLPFSNKPVNSYENSFDSKVVYQKRRLQNRKLSKSPTSRLFSLKNPINNNRSNSNESLNLNLNRINNFDMKNVDNNNLYTHMNRASSPIAYVKNKNILTENKFNYNYNNDDEGQNNYNNMNNIFYNNTNSNTNSNINTNNNSFNKTVKKRRYLISSKTSENFRKLKINIPQYEDLDFDNDNMNYNNQLKSNRGGGNIYSHTNYNDNSSKTKHNHYNEMNDYQFPQRTSRNSNQFSPYIKPNKINFSNSSNKYFNKNDYYNDNDDNEYDNEDNKYSNHKNNINIMNDYSNSNDYNNDYNNNYNNNNNNYNNNNDYNNSKDYNNNDYNKDYEDNDYINVNLLNRSGTKKGSKKQKKFESMINIEDFIFLEEKLNEIIYDLKNGIIIKNQCLDFWNYFYENNLYEKIEKTFSGEDDTGIIKSSLNYALLSIMLCYEFSFDRNVLIKAHILLLEILELNHRSIILYCENILNKISIDNQENVWVLKLYEIVQLSKIEDKKFYSENSSCPERIRANTEKIDKKLRNILVNYKTEYSLYIKGLLNKKTLKNYEEINDFFNEYILRMEKNLPNDQINSEFKAIRPPYILTPRTKPYTLVLSLDETLVNFQQMNYTQGILKLRPYLLEFLEQVSIYYELVLFTTESEHYVEPIIKAIEQRRKYFDFIFYKENCIMIGNDYVKDLSRIGRPLDSTIIVDNVSQHFRFQKENGITIKSFWAKDPGDKALYNLIPILINIAEEEIDVRDGIEKYKNEIMMKVSTSKNYI